MNRRQLLTGVASAAVAPALPALAMPAEGSELPLGWYRVDPKGLTTLGWDAPAAQYRVVSRYILKLHELRPIDVVWEDDHRDLVLCAGTIKNGESLNLPTETICLD